MNLSEFHQEQLVAGQLVIVEATEAVRYCSNGSFRVERGDSLTYTGRIVAIAELYFKLQVAQAGKLNIVTVEWKHAIVKLS